MFNNFLTLSSASPVSLNLFLICSQTEPNPSFSICSCIYDAAIDAFSTHTSLISLSQAITMAQGAVSRGTAPLSLQSFSLSSVSLSSTTMYSTDFLPFDVGAKSPALRISFISSIDNLSSLNFLVDLLLFIISNILPPVLVTILYNSILACFIAVNNIS
ncbi:hypothetical protein SDC9_172124 [bioreactor metagenome]|uniref:Uncharacterized protein n=1 Tax=bioreactor metagenome TaxID=1076179 RepID=A0A645GFB6_9ZZZZ